jgi:hypothetical protein
VPLFTASKILLSSPHNVFGRTADKLLLGGYGMQRWFAAVSVPALCALIRNISAQDTHVFLGLGRDDWTQPMWRWLEQGGWASP